jgi:hypothetical protein
LGKTVTLITNGSNVYTWTLGGNRAVASEFAAVNTASTSIAHAEPRRWLAAW